MIRRRTLVQGGASFGVFGLAGHAKALERQGFLAPSGAVAPFNAAVMRVPVLAPPSTDAFEDIRRRNSEAMVEAIESVMRKVTPKPRIVVFPVLQYTSAKRAVSGVPMEMAAVDLVSKPLDQGVFAPVVEACRRHNCYVATSTQEKVPQLENVFFHTGFIMGPEGLVLRSPKAQAWSAPDVASLRTLKADYRSIFGADSILPVVKTPLGNLACFVEAEGEVLEAGRLLASKGAELILHTSMEKDEVPWRALKQAIGYQCHVFLLTGATSRLVYAGDREDVWMGGEATIVGPEGRVRASKGGEKEGFAVAEIDLTDIRSAKEQFGRYTTPAWHLYEELYRR